MSTHHKARFLLPATAQGLDDCRVFRLPVRLSRTSLIALASGVVASPGDIVNVGTFRRSTSQTSMARTRSAKRRVADSDGAHGPGFEHIGNRGRRLQDLGSSTPGESISSVKWSVAFKHPGNLCWR